MNNYPSSRNYSNSSYSKHLSQHKKKSRNDPVVKCKVNDNSSNYENLMNGFGVRCKPKKTKKNSLKYSNLSLSSLKSYSRIRKMCKSNSSRVANRSRVRSRSASKGVLTGRMGMSRNRCHSNPNFKKLRAKTVNENCNENYYCSNCVSSQRNKRKFCGSCGIEMSTENECKSRRSTKSDYAAGSSMKKSVGAEGLKINENESGKQKGKSDKDNVNSGKGNQGGKSDKDKTNPGKGNQGSKSDKDKTSSKKANQVGISDKDNVNSGKGNQGGKSDKDNINSGKDNQGGVSDKDKIRPGKGNLVGKSDNNDALSEEKTKGVTSDIENVEIETKDCLEACKKCEQCKKVGDNVKKNCGCDDLNLCISCGDNAPGHAVVKINEMQVFEGKNLSIRIDICENGDKNSKKNNSCAPYGSKRKSCSFKSKSSVCDNFQCKINECLEKKLLEMKNYCERHNLNPRNGFSCEENNSFDKRQPTGSCNLMNCSYRNQFANNARNLCTCENCSPHLRNQCKCGSELPSL